MALLDPSSPRYRYIVLFFNCILTFGAYFCQDQPGVLETQLQRELALSNTQYSIMYTSYALANGLVALFGGVITDRLGTVRATYLFTLVIVAGVTGFALAAQLRLYWLMILCRFLFGMGGGSLTIAQNTISTLWFRGKELSFAFGFTLTASRLGSVLNFNVTPSIAQTIGLVPSLWFGALLCVLSLGAAVIYARLEKRADRFGVAATTTRSLNFSVITSFPKTFWILSLICMCFYQCIFPFVAFASDFFQAKWHMSQRGAGAVTGIIYDLSLFVSPPVGLAIDIVGRRASIMLFASILTAPAFLLLGFSYVTPVLAMLLLAVGYALMAPTVWPAVPLVIEDSQIGTAYGAMTALQMVGFAVWSFGVGALKDVMGLVAYSLLFLVCSVLAIAACIWLLLVDRHAGGAINAAGVGSSALPSACRTGGGLLAGAVFGVRKAVIRVATRHRRRGARAGDVALTQEETERLIETHPFEDDASVRPIVLL